MSKNWCQICDEPRDCCEYPDHRIPEDQQPKDEATEPFLVGKEIYGGETDQ